jgi:Sulfite exporter TauE/SafE
MWCLIASVISINQIFFEGRLKEKYQAGLCEGEIQLTTTKKCTIFLTKVFLSGIVSGFFGLGGTAMLTSIYLGMGIPPQVASATTKFVGMYSKIATCLVYYMAGLLNIPYSIWISVWKIAGGVYILKKINDIVKKTGRQSLIVMFLTISLGMAALSFPIISGLEVWNNYKNDPSSLFKTASLCE